MNRMLRSAAMFVTFTAACSCGRRDAHQHDEPPASASGAPSAEPSAPLPAKEAVPAGAGWWCYEIGAGTVPLSMCFRDRTPCEESSSSIAADVKHTGCVEQREAACFTFRHATGPVIASCQGSLAACRYRVAEWRRRPEGTSDFSQCATFR